MSSISKINHPKDEDDWVVDTLWWIITGRCNLKCKHCYIEAPSSKYGELSYDLCVKVIEQAKEAGIQHVFLTGGEPFIRSDIAEIIGGIFEGGMDIKGIETNGTLLPEDIMDSLSSRNITYCVSFDGVRFSDDFRGVPGIGDKIIANMRLIKEQGYGSLVVNSILSKDNIVSILETYDLIRELGVEGWRIFTPTKIGLQKLRNDDIDWESEGQTYLAILRKWMDDERPFDLSLGTILVLSKENELSCTVPSFVCDYFRSTVTLLPDGVLVPCCRHIASMETMQGMESVFQQSIKDQIHCSRVKDFKNTKLSDLKSHEVNEECSECKLGDQCQLGCRMNGYLETGHLFSHESKHCRLMTEYYERCLKTLNPEFELKENLDE